jgi:hypothetical protein
MDDTELALLRSIIRNPAQSHVPAIEGMIQRLHQNGYVVLEPSGWIATRKGCEAVEQIRAERSAHWGVAAP